MSETRASTPSGKSGGRTSPATFYRQVVAELRKVVWPTQNQVVTYFFVVLVFVLVMMAIVAGLDFAFGKAMFAVFA
ncbi:preprotein translocase subunit SecE [Solicola gregarius]|uniref:Protein translocase subunit SecE n=1 Tax=Solicola gregarius TaxID=2908642 RepID=A0AA46TFN9_9ACTN|nr:preprotein translocase subunit SecE [Solicola gregarius]UYM03713.1 preprotein translocase subunit SecE [Solicola gregarius]